MSRTLAALLLAALAATPAAGDDTPAATRAWREAAPTPSQEDYRKVGVEKEVVDLLEERTGGRPELLYGPKGPHFPAVGLAWSAPATQADEIVRQNRDALAARGYVVFVAERNFGTALDHVGLVHSSDRFAPLRALGTSGPTYDVSTEDVVKRLDGWSRFAPFDLLGAGPDWVEVEFRTVPRAVDALVTELRDLAPDSLGRDADAAKQLAAEIRRTRRVMLWWE